MTLALNVEELKKCNDLIEKFKSDVEFKQKVITKQQQEMNDLKTELKIL